MQNAAAAVPAYLDLPVNNSAEAIEANIRANLARDHLPRLVQLPARQTQLAIVGGGPSLEKYLPMLRQFRPDCHVLAVNGAYGYLRKRGIDPEHFVLIDSRIENATHVASPCKTTKHYLATQVDPSIVDALEGYDVTLFNLGTDTAHRVHKTLGLKEITAISAPIGMASVHAVYLAAALGYRRILLFGYDFSHDRGTRYAFEQPLNDKDEAFEVTTPDGRKFYTTLAMARTAEQFFKAISPLFFKPCELDVQLCSDGLLRAMLEAQIATPTEASERAKYEAIWEIDGYRKISPGLECIADAVELLGAPAGASFGDFGCGTGRVLWWLHEHGFRAAGVDIAANCLSDVIPLEASFTVAPLWDAARLPQVDYGFSCDVLEHIPPEKVEDTLKAIHGACTVGCYFNIDTIPDGFGVNIGETLHLTVMPASWWETKLREIWPHVRLVRDDGRQAIFVCRK